MSDETILRAAAAQLGIPLAMPKARAWYRHPTKGERFGTFSRRPSKWDEASRALIAPRGCTSSLRKIERAGVKVIPPKGNPLKYLSAHARAKAA